MKLFDLTVVTLGVTLGAAILPAVATAQSAPAAAQSGASLTVGATVYDPQGGEVGKIESIAGENAVIDTGTNKATLPKSAFGTGANGPVISATKAQLDALVSAAAAEADAALTAALIPGAEVRGKSGTLVGTVKEVNGDQVVLDRPAGLVTLLKPAFATGPSGLIISMTAAELEAAASATTSEATPGT